MAQSGSDKAWSDDPIKSADEDQLGRWGFAVQVADLIKGGHSSNRSTVYGLLGPWGSGKSSMINMVEHALHESAKDWAIRRYTPWSASDSDSITAEFFRTLSQALPAETSKKLRHSVRQYARLATPILKAIPLAGEAVSSVADRVLDTYTQEPSWQEQFDELSHDLAQLELCVLIVVDDIDRLHKDELLSLFKTVRLLGRFPGIDYMLAYDEESVLSVLTGSELLADEDRALRYLEKIVQHPLTIPPVQAVHLDRIFDEGLTSIFGPSRATWSELDVARLEDCYYQSLRERLNTVRAVHRFLAQIRQYLPLLPDTEVNHVDYVLLSFLRLHHPKLYERLPRNKDKLLSGRPDTSPGETLTNEERNVRIRAWMTTELLSTVASGSAASVERVLIALFPTLSSIDLQGIEGYLAMGGARRVLQNHYFARYFALGLPADDVSDQAVAETIKAIALGDSTSGDWLKELLVESVASGSRKVLDKVRISTPLERGPGAELLLRYGLTVVAEAQDDPVRFLKPRRLLLPWLADLVLRLPQSGPSAVRLLAQGPLTDRELMRTVQLASNQHHEARARGGDHFTEDEVAELTAAAGAYAQDEILRIITKREFDTEGAQVYFLYTVTISYNPPGSTEASIWRLIDAGETSLAEVAALWITVSADDAGNAELSGFNESYFGRIAEHRGFVPLRPTPLDSLDLTDVSWSNRVRYAALVLQNWGPDEFAQQDAGELT